MRLIKTISVLGFIAGALVAVTTPASAAKYNLEYEFKGGVDGWAPYSSLIDVDGKLYGTTSAGGANGVGAIYAFDPATGAETIVYSFTGGADGHSPTAALTNVDGMLYGSAAGGAGGAGVVFSFDPSTGAQTVLGAFEGHGSIGPSAMVAVGHTLYGTTPGGHNAGGTVFSIDLGSGAETVLHAFKADVKGDDGSHPVGAPVLLHGMLYGVTFDGGPTFHGALYKIDPVSGREHVVYGFTGGTDGGNPNASLIAANGVLYGTTYFGGSNGRGTVFSFDPATGVEKVLYAFTGGSDGQEPSASLVMLRGVLYGVTPVAGAGGCGTVYSLDPTSGALQVLHAFDCKRPNAPGGGLLYTSHSLFGSLTKGGKDVGRGGGVFSIKP
jgi:uncharacterized repeat protein (TIGR03803 family)